MSSHTIIAAAVPQARLAGTLLSTDTRLDLLPEGSPDSRRFKIKSAESISLRQRTNTLLGERYAWRGYQSVSLPKDQTVNRITLSAVDGGETIGTITVALDGPEKLAADDSFADKMEELRSQGLRLCEFTKLAVDPTVASKRILAALFHVSFVVAHRMRDYDTLVIEVNPRHVRYYERLLGLRVLAEARLNRKVNAPAVLMTADFTYIMEQIGEFGGRPDLAATERSLYPLAFSLREEAGIIARLMRAQRPASEQIN